MISDLFLSRSRTQLYGYDKVRLPFHIIRAAQWVCSLIVSIIMSFFMYHLHVGNYPNPWTFKVLMTVSWLTIGCLGATTFLHLSSGLNPRLNLILNSTMFGIWNIGCGMLTWWMWGTLTHYCDPGHWNDGNGIMVCKIYKALFTFTLLGNVSTLLAMILDFHIIRMNRMRGQHSVIGTFLRDRKFKRDDSSPKGPYVDIDNQPDSNEDLAHDNGAIHMSRFSRRESQFDYDTGYHAVAATERVFGARN